MFGRCHADSQFAQKEWHFRLFHRLATCPWTRSILKKMVVSARSDPLYLFYYHGSCPSDNDGTPSLIVRPDATFKLAKDVLLLLGSSYGTGHTYHCMSIEEKSGSTTDPQLASRRLNQNSWGQLIESSRAISTNMNIRFSTLRPCPESNPSSKDLEGRRITILCSDEARVAAMKVPISTAAFFGGKDLGEC